MFPIFGGVTMIYSKYHVMHKIPLKTKNHKARNSNSHSTAYKKPQKNDDLTTIPYAILDTAVRENIIESLTAILFEFKAHSIELGNK